MHCNARCNCYILQHAVLHTATQCNTIQDNSTHRNFLQHTVTHCTTLQHTAPHCNTLQHTAPHCNTHCKTLQTTAIHPPEDGPAEFEQKFFFLHCIAIQCNTLLRISPHFKGSRHCNALQHTATLCSTQQHTDRKIIQQHSKCSSEHFTLQHTVTHCNTLQHTATHCNTLPHTATHCNTLQHNATHCNTLTGRWSSRIRSIPVTKLPPDECVAVCCSVLQCVAVCCSVVQCVAVHCNVV